MIPPERQRRPCPLDLNCLQMGATSSGPCINLGNCIVWSDRLASRRQTNHQLRKQDRSWHCETCGYIWRSKPQSECPHRKQYGPNRPYPGVVATRSELQKMGLIATRLSVGVAWSMAGKEFYDLYDLKAVKPRIFAPKLRIFRVYRLWKGELVGVERTWKGKPEGAGLLEYFYTYEEAQQTLAQLRSHPCQNLSYKYEWQHVPGLPDEIYALVLPQPWNVVLGGSR